MNESASFSPGHLELHFHFTSLDALLVERALHLVVLARHLVHRHAVRLALLAHVATHLR